MQAEHVREADPAMADAEARLSVLASRLRQPPALDCDGRWECDRRGAIVWSDGDAPAEGDPLGDFDDAGPLAVAFSRRAPFRDVETPGWRLCGVPTFAPNGAFTGYRGTASRIAPANRPGLFDTGASVDSFAQMAHEVRTPLTAIMGFAQMIEGQTHGAANPAYRAKALAIVENATRLLEAVDDLADATRLEQGRYAADGPAADIEALIGALTERVRPVAARAGVRLLLTVLPPLPGAAIDERTLSRAFDRTMAALLACAADELVTIGVQAEGRAVDIVISRPHALLQLSPSELLDPSRRIACPGASAPILGIGFGLRLAKRLIEATGGRFEIERQSIRLTIPGIANPALSA